MKRSLPMLLCCLAAASPAVAQFLPAPVYVELDGRWYETEWATPFIWINRPVLFLRAARMDLCNRTDGQSQVFGGAFYAYAGTFSVPIYQVTSWRVHRPAGSPGITVISVNTLPGNIGCLNEVAPPYAETIFRHGFELDGVMVNGFEVAPPQAPATSTPLKMTLTGADGASCVFTTNANGLNWSTATNVIKASGDFDCSGTGDPYGSGFVMNGPTTWNVAIPWRVGQARTVNWYAYPFDTCAIVAQPLSGQPTGALALTGDQSCSGIGTGPSQPTPQVCWNLNRSLTMTPSASGAYLLSLFCHRNGVQQTNQRTLVVSPAL